MTARSRWGIGVSAIVLVIVVAAFLGTTRSRNSVQARGIGSGSAAAGVVFASPGRVEGASETTQVGAAADGILKAVYVKEGQFVKRGTLLGEIGCDDLQASLQTAIAEADGARQARTRILRGARDEEKKIAIEKTAAARARMSSSPKWVGKPKSPTSPRECPAALFISMESWWARSPCA